MSYGSKVIWNWNCYDISHVCVLVGIIISMMYPNCIVAVKSARIVIFMTFMCLCIDQGYDFYEIYCIHHHCLVAVKLSIVTIFMTFVVFVY